MIGGVEPGPSSTGRTTELGICLAMIVRDAEDFILETLASVAPFIHEWVVIDTGSGDDTAATVQSFFDAAGIPGTLLRRPWVGFAHNRTELLQNCAGHGHFALMMDADDMLFGTLPLYRLDADSYRLRFGTEFMFWRSGLFRLSRRWEFRGAVHEYAVCLDDGAITKNLDGPYNFVYRSLGSRARDPQRFQRDIDVLLASQAEHPDDARTAFYLAQSYRDAGDDERALHWYSTRAAMPGWDEETFVAALEAARIGGQRADATADDVSRGFLSAWALRPGRAEPLHDLARWHRERSRWADGYLTATRAASIPFPTDDLLFVNADVYSWRSTDERAVCAFHLGLHEEAIGLGDRLLASPALPLEQRDRVLANRNRSAEFTRGRNSVYQPDLVGEVVSHVEARHLDTTPAVVTLTITACRRRELFERTVDSFLTCCADWRRIDRWICIDDGSSEADRALMRTRYPFFEFIMNDPDERGHARSMNRLLQEVQSPFWLHLEDDWEFIAVGRLVEPALEILDDDSWSLQVVLNRNFAETLDHQELVGGEVVRTSRDGFAYRRHVYFPSGSAEFEQLLANHPGKLTNSHWPGFTLMPSMIRTAALHAVGAFSAGSNDFELDMANRLSAAGWRTASLDTITCLTTGRIRNDNSTDAPPNAYELIGRQQYPLHQQISVAVVANWRSGDEVAMQWRRQFPAQGSWRGVRLVAAADCVEPPDYWMIVNHPRAEDPVPPPERSIVLQMEPSGATHTWGTWGDPDPSVFAQVRSHALTPNFCEWHLDASYDQLWTMPINKSRTLSTVVSGRRHSIAQNQRLDLVHELERHQVPIDVFGRDNSERFANYCGPLPELDKRDGLFPYRYTIAIENSAEPNYMTEKLVDAVLAECLCFYWGCPDAEELLGDDAFIRLPIADPAASREVVEGAIAAGEFERRLPAIRRAKRRILDDLQLAPTLARVVHGHRLAEDLRMHVINIDRRPDRLAGFRTRFAEALGPASVDRCERFSAVDGHDLQMTDEIAHLFRSSQLPLRRHQTACALSHLSLWWETANGDGRTSLIFEDDACFETGFKTRLVEVCGWLQQHANEADVIFLGQTSWADVQPSTVGRQRVERVEVQPRTGGTFAYIITRRGARRLLDVAKETGISAAIDTFTVNLANQLGVWNAVPRLVTSPVALRGGVVIDSDIQYDLSTL